jgi:hypothetical protein
MVSKGMAATDDTARKGIPWGVPWGSPWTLSLRSVFRYAAGVYRYAARLERELEAVKAQLATIDERRQVPKETLLPRKLPGRDPVERERVCREIIGYLAENLDRIDRVAARDAQAVGAEKASRHDFGCERGVLRSARETVGAAIRLAKQGVSEEKLAALRDEDVAERCAIKKTAFVRSIRSIYPDVFLLITTIKTLG